ARGGQAYQGAARRPARSPNPRAGHSRRSASRRADGGDHTGAVPRRALSRSAAPDESVRTILDPGGSIVACSRTTQPAAGRPQAEPMLERTRGRSEGVYRDTMPDGRRVYVAFSRRAVWGWTAAVTLPVDALDGAPRRSALALAAIGLIAFIISAAGAVVLSRRLTGDIGAAADAAQALADGSGPPIVPSIVTEVRRLGHSLDRSARLLDQRERER